MAQHFDVRAAAAALAALPSTDESSTYALSIVRAEKEIASARSRHADGLPHSAANALRAAAHALYQAADALTNEAGERESMTAKEVA